MAPTPSIRSIKEFTYRGGLQRFSNRYHFNGGTPITFQQWDLLRQNIRDFEMAIFPPSVHVVEWVGYNAGSELPVFTVTDNTAGTFTTAGAIQCAGDCAAVLRYTTTARSTKNHPIYLYNYFHAAFRAAGTNPDALEPTQIAAIDAFAAKWQTGFTDGQNTLVRAGPNGASAVGHLVHTEVRHRDFPD